MLITREHWSKLTDHSRARRNIFWAHLVLWVLVQVCHTEYIWKYQISQLWYQIWVFSIRLNWTHLFWNCHMSHTFLSYTDSFLLILHTRNTKMEFSLLSEDDINDNTRTMIYTPHGRAIRPVKKKAGQNYLLNSQLA